MTETLAGHPWLYPALLHLHRACVAASIILFMARGLGVAAQQGWPLQARWRYLSVAIDVLLLVAGVSLWVFLGLHPLQQTWLGVKLVLLVVYIVLGSFALKRARTHGQRLAFFVAALAVVFYMVGIALMRHPAGWWAT
jgi:uncharacterized membrane protein SirB2